MAQANPTHLRSERILYPAGNENREGELTSQGAGRANRDDGHVEPIIQSESSASRHHSGSSPGNAPVLNIDELSIQPLVTSADKGRRDLDISPKSGQSNDPPSTIRHTRDHVLLSEAKATEAGPSHNNTDCRGTSSTGRIFDVFAEFEKEFGKSPTTRDTQKLRPSFAAERHREPAAGGTAVAEGKGDKAGQSRDSLLTQNYRPKKRRRRSLTFDSGCGVKRSYSSRPAASSVGRGPPLVNDDNQYAVECLRERRNRGRKIKYLVKWQGYGEADNGWVKKADIHPGLIEDFASAAV
jgi:hypothetical protein